MSTFVIAAYHCEVARVPTDSIDYQVRYFESNSIDEVETRLKDELPVTYLNVYGQEVRWVFHNVVAFEENAVLEDGREIIGFITRRPKEVSDE